MLYGIRLKYLTLKFHPKRVAVLILVLCGGPALLGKMVVVTVGTRVYAADGVLSLEIRGVHGASAPTTTTAFGTDRTRRVRPCSHHKTVLRLGLLLEGALARVPLLVLLDLLQHTVQAVGDLSIFTRELFLELLNVQSERLVLTRL